MNFGRGLIFVILIKGIHSVGDDFIDRKISQEVSKKDAYLSIIIICILKETILWSLSF